MRAFALGAVVVLAVLAVSGLYLGLTGLAAAPNEACDGVPRKLGGCDPDQPRFTATTCAGLGQELGSEIDRHAVAIINGPSSPVDSDATRMTFMTGLVATRLDQHLVANDLRGACTVDELLEVAEGQFSQKLRSRIGDYLYDADPGSFTYEDWFARLRQVLTIIEG